jgi:flagellar basal body-associated protein FliL
MMMIIMGMLGLIIVALVGVAVFLFLNMGNLAGGESGGGPETDFVVQGAAPPISEQVMFDISDAIATNLGNYHFVRLENMALGINNTDPAAAVEFMRELTTKERAVMDAIHRILRNTSIEDLSRPEGADLLREDILDALQVAFESHMIVAVYLTIYTVPI